MNIAWLFYNRGIMLTDKKISKTDTTKNMYSYWLPDVKFTHNIYRTHVWFEPLLNLKDTKMMNDCTLLLTGSIDDFYYISGF